MLVVAEMTLAVLLLSGAGLLVQSLIRLQRVDLGFESKNRLAVRLVLPRERYAGIERAAPFTPASWTAPVRSPAYAG
jgi:putative ABC transport system permease protein